MKIRQLCECPAPDFDERGVCSNCDGLVDEDEELACRVCNAALSVVEPGPNELERIAYLIDCSDASEAVRARALTLAACVVESEGAK